MVGNREFRKRTKAYHEKSYDHFYFMTLSSDEVIDATVRGSISRFINHSCDPNCETQKWVVDRRVRVGIFAKRAIKAGTEITFDYKFERFRYALVAAVSAVSASLHLCMCPFVCLEESCCETQILSSLPAAPHSAATKGKCVTVAHPTARESLVERSS